MNRMLVALSTVCWPMLSVAAPPITEPVDVNVTNPVLPVEVSNADPIPVALVGQAARIPYSDDDVGECNTANCFFEYPTVPAGKRLVILHANGVARPGATTTVFDQAELVTSDTESATGARHTFAMTKIGRAGSSIGADTWGFDAPVLAFVTAGNAPRVTMFTSVGIPEGFMFSQVTLSGYLEDAPSP
jgi:hypothetical protein